MYFCLASGSRAPQRLAASVRNCVCFTPSFFRSSWIFWRVSWIYMANAVCGFFSYYYYY
jgi:hypothetical protein